MESHLADIRNFITERMTNLRALLAGDPWPARKELLNHVSEIRMMLQAVNGKSHYVAKGSWHLLGTKGMAQKPSLRKFVWLRGPAGYQP